jgi:predicted PurR-regulated permease PerM
MSAGGDQDPLQATSATTIDLAIRIGFIAFLGYWSFHIIAPFLTIALWSAILAVALYPLFAWLARRMPPRMAASVVTLLCLMIVLGPMTWLGFGMIGGARALATRFAAGEWVIPVPSEAVKGWPLVGERVYRLWDLAATNMKVALAEVAPTLKPVGERLLKIAQSGFLAMLELLVAIVVSGFLFTHGPQLVEALKAFLDRALGHHGNEHVQLAGATIRNVSRGVIGIALLQAILAGVGFLAAGIPAAGVLAFVALVLGIIQLGPAILFLPLIIWSWTAMETMQALLFTAYMIPVGLVDNILKPLLMARGLTTPMPVIMVGVIGGTIAYGIVGLFFGPIVLSVAWAVMVAWVQGSEPIAAEGVDSSTHAEVK